MRERIIEAIKHDNDGSDREEIIKQNIKGKDVEFIKQYLNINIKNLIDTPPEEIGGLTAITGFYYQFLVTIEYLIEMYKGKWDLVAIELHDDIVAVKENKVRFIQVKTSKHPASVITSDPARSLYLRGKKKIEIDRVNKDRDISNSWIDKLIDKSKYFKDSNNTVIEFELITSFNIINAKSMEVDNYRIRNKSIDIDDSIYRSVIKESYKYVNEDEIPQLVNYKELYGKNLEELLSKFYINDKGDNIGKIDKYINHICKEIESCIGNISVNKDDIDWIIGKMCSMCNISSAGYILTIDSERLKEIFYEIERRAINRAELEVEERAIKTLINNIHKDIHEECECLENYENIEKSLIEYKEYLIEWINNNGGIHQFINRYLSGSKFSNKCNTINGNRKNDLIREILIMPIILQLLYDSEVKYVDNSSLLTKNINNADGKYISFIGLDRGRINKKIEDIKNILRQLDDDEILKSCMYDSLNIILQGYSDSSFNKVVSIEVEDDIKQEDNVDLVEFLSESKHSLKKVPIVANILPGEAIKDYLLKELLDEDEWDKSILEGFWKDIMEG